MLLLLAIYPYFSIGFNAFGVKTDYKMYLVIVEYFWFDYFVRILSMKFKLIYFLSFKFIITVVYLKKESGMRSNIPPIQISYCFL